MSESSSLSSHSLDYNLDHFTLTKRETETAAVPFTNLPNFLEYFCYLAGSMLIKSKINLVEKNRGGGSRPANIFQE